MILPKYTYSVLDMCQDIHMSKSGAGDPLTPDEALEKITTLSTRLANWEEGSNSSRAYDLAVKNLIQVTLKEFFER